MKNPAGPVPSAPRRPGRPRLIEPSEEYNRKRDAIVDVAAKVFRQQGYASASLDDVAEAMNMRKATLYYYVKSKDHLLDMIFERALSGGIASLERLAAIESPDERLRALIRFQIEIVADDPGHFAIFFDQMSIHQGGAERGAKNTLLRDLERRYFSIFRKTVENAIQAGVLPAVEPIYATQIIIGLTSWTYKWFDNSRHSAKALEDAAIQMLMGSAPRPKAKRKSAS